MSPTTLDRLKSLPLTIVLTVLIWMYAEAKFTATQENVRVAIRPTNADLALRAYDAADNRFVSVLNVLVTIEGPQNQVDRIYRESLGSVQQDEDFTTLNYSPPPASLKLGTDNHLDTVAALNSLHYFRKFGVTVTAATPPRLQLEVERLETLIKPVNFHAAFPAAHFVATPDTVSVRIPAPLLAAIGGPDHVTVNATPIKDGSTLTAAVVPTPAGQQTIPVRYDVDYPGAQSTSRDERITVTPTQGTIVLNTGTTNRQETATIPNVPVWVSGPPTLLSKCDVTVTPPTLKLVVGGPPSAIAVLRAQLAGPRNTAADLGIRAYLDIFPDDTSNAGRTLKRTVRFMLPDNLVVQSTNEVQFRLTEHPPTTSPAK